jgi:hypothetical protein
LSCRIRHRRPAGSPPPKLSIPWPSDGMVRDWRAATLTRIVAGKDELLHGTRTNESANTHTHTATDDTHTHTHTTSKRREMREGYFRYPDGWTNDPGIAQRYGPLPFTQHVKGRWSLFWEMTPTLTSLLLRQL